jgi:hypothetical protein
MPSPKPLNGFKLNLLFKSTLVVVRFIFNPYLFSMNNQVEEDEMGGPCSTNGGEEERVYNIGGKVRGKETTRKTKT